MSHLQYDILHYPAQCRGAGAAAGAKQSRYLWSEPEPMKRRKKNVFYHSLAYFYIKRSRSQKRVSGAWASKSEPAPQHCSAYSKKYTVFQTKHVMHLTATYCIGIRTAQCSRYFSITKTHCAKTVILYSNTYNV